MPVSIFAGGLVIAWTYMRRWRAVGKCAVASRSVIDVSSAADAVTLVRRLSVKHPTSEKLATFMADMYVRFPPSEGSVRLMTEAHAGLAGSGGEKEYAVCTVLSAMMVATSESRSIDGPDGRDRLHLASVPRVVLSCRSDGSETPVRSDCRVDGVRRHNSDSDADGVPPRRAEVHDVETEDVLEHHVEGPDCEGLRGQETHHVP